MDKNAIIELTRDLLRVPRNKLVVRQNGWVNMPCPLAPWRHKKGTDASPSFGIKISPNDVSVCNCYTCGYKRPLSDLVEEYANRIGKNYDLDVEMIRKGEFLGGDVPEWGDLNEEDSLERYDPADAVDPMVLDIFDSAAGHQYLLDREIDEQTAEEMHLLVDEEDSDGDERILFPVFDIEGNVYGMSGRATDSKVDLRVRDYQGLNKRLFLLGLQRYKPSWKYVVLVEGLFDVSRLVQYEEPVLGVMGSTLTPAQAEWLIEIGLPVYCMYDNDEAGAKATKTTINALKDHLPIFTVEYPDRKVYNRKERKWELVKDPDQLSYEEVREMIDNAEFA